MSEERSSTTGDPEMERIEGLCNRIGFVNYKRRTIDHKRKK